MGRVLGIELWYNIKVLCICKEYVRYIVSESLWRYNAENESQSSSTVTWL